MDTIIKDIEAKIDQKAGEIVEMLENPTLGMDTSPQEAQVDFYRSLIELCKGFDKSMKAINKLIK